MSAIKDVLLKLQLSSVNCGGHCNDGASNMMKYKTGVVKRIQDTPLSLSVKDTTKNCQRLWTQQKTIGHYGHSNKNSFPHKGFSKISSEIKGNLEGPGSEAKGILGLYPTLFLFCKNKFYKNIDAEIYEILRIF